MRILYVSKLAPHLGLPHVFELSRRFVQRGHEVTVISAATHREQRREEYVDGIRMLAVPTAPPKLRTPNTVGFFATRLPFYGIAPSFARRNVGRPDVIIEDVAPLWCPGLPRLAEQYGAPLIYQTHTAYQTVANWTKAYGGKGLVGFAEERWLRARPRCAALFSDAKWTADAYSDLPCPVRWIPNGVDGDRFRPATSRSGDGPLRVLTVARLVPLKNHEVLIRAMADHRNDVSLVIVGTGPSLGRLRRLTEALGLADSVAFAGQLGGQALLEQYQRAELFCLPSLYEGLPHAVLEAMASALPVAMSAERAADGLIESDYGWRLPAESREAWSALFSYAKSDRALLRRMGAHARRVATERFRWERAADDALSLIHGAVDGNIPAPR